MAAIVTLMALVGVLPYIALQLKAVGNSLNVLTAQGSVAAGDPPFWQGTTFAVAITMAVFTIMFGVRHIHASEHHRGLIMQNCMMQKLHHSGASFSLSCFPSNMRELRSEAREVSWPTQFSIAWFTMPTTSPDRCILCEKPDVPE